MSKYQLGDITSAISKQNVIDIFQLSIQKSIRWQNIDFLKCSKGTLK